MFESLASCFAAYMPSFGWRESPRLRGFAFRCSASLNMTDSSTPLQKQMHVFRQFSTDPFCSCDLLDACVAEAIHRTEPPQQQIFPVLTHPRTIVENALLDTLFHEQLMICVSESMRFIPDALKQSQGRGIHWKPDRQCPAGAVNLLVFFRQPDDRKIMQTESLQFTASG